MNIFLRVMIFLIGGFSMLCNFTFYASFAVGINALALGCFGLISDTTKLVAAKTFSESSINPEKKGAGFSGFLIWTVTTILSFFAMYGFLSGVLQSHDNTQLKASHAYESGLIAINNAQHKVEGLASYANSGNAEAAKLEKQRLKKELKDYIAQPALNGKGVAWGTIASTTGNCSKKTSYYVKAHCPKIEALEAEIEVQSAIIKGYGRYTSATSYLEKTSVKLSDLTAGGDTVHAAFRDIGDVVGISHQLVKIIVLGMLALIAEFTTSYFIYLLTSVFGNPDRLAYDEGTVSEQYQNPHKMVSVSQSIVNKSFRKPILNRLLTLNDSVDKRFKHATKALNNPVRNDKTGKWSTEIIPSKYGITAWCKQNRGAIPNSLVISWQEQWLEMGLIEPCKSKNGSDTYRVKD